MECSKELVLYVWRARYDLRRRLGTNPYSLTLVLGNRARWGSDRAHSHYARHPAKIGAGQHFPLLHGATSVSIESALSRRAITS